MVRIIIILLIFIPSLAMAYTPPIGIPDPSLSFGSFGEIDQDPPTTGSGGARCTGWPSTTSEGCYYVDNSVTCDNTNCANRGCPNAPRCNLPDMSALAAGTYIEVHSGSVPTPYTDSLKLASAGTDANPVWIVGVANGTAKPILNASWNMPNTSEESTAIDYTVITGFQQASNTYMDIRPRTVLPNIQTINHLIVRDMLWAGELTNTNSAILMAGYNFPAGSYVKNIVIYNNTIHTIGNPETVGSEIGGIEVGESSNIWILDNTIYDVAEDNIAGCHSCADGKEPRNIFVGRNTLSHPGANNIDFKHVHGAIISENILSGSPYTSRCPDDGCGAPVYHYSGGVNHSENVWTIFNTGYNMGSAWIAKDCIDCHFVGNVLYNFTCEAGEECGPTNYYPTAITSFGMGRKNYVVDNTLYGNYSGIRATIGTADELSVTGNLIAGRTSSTAYEIVVDSVGAGVTVDRNMFKGGSASDASAFYVGSTAYTYANFKGLEAAPCEHCKDYVVDSLTIGFTNEGSNVFTLTASSSAIGANTESPVYDYFNTIWTTPETGLCAVYGTVCTGLSIHYDRAGKSRPIGGTWDIGAYEYDPSTAKPSMSIGSGAAMSIGSGATATLY